MEGLYFRVDASGTGFLTNKSFIRFAVNGGAMSILGFPMLLVRILELADWSRDAGNDDDRYESYKVDHPTLRLYRPKMR
jgi:hypothetical protein